MKLLAKTMAGLEEVLAGELHALGAAGIVPLKRAVQFEGNLRLLYRANLELRTALRILRPIQEFRAVHDNMLYKRVKQIDWSMYMDVNDTLAVDAVTHSPIFKHSKFAALRVKDAIVDQFRQTQGKRPSVDVHSPTLRIHLHISNEHCTLLLDSSGDSLHMRGYRTETVEAPINEVLAAGMVLLSGWRGDGDLVDPMCGSGTLLIEAATYAMNIAPQLQRRDFGFMKWKDFHPKLWKEVRDTATAATRPLDHRILGFDKDSRAVEATRQNINTAGLNAHIRVEKENFESLQRPGQEGTILMNPPYDERLSEENIEELYGRIGDQLKQNFSGWEAWIISSNKDALKKIGLRPSRKITLYNGPLECKFQKYELYRGSRKKKNIEP